METKHNFLTPSQVKDGCRILNPNDKDEQRICVINEEFRQGFDIIESNKKFKKSVTFFGSARLSADSPFYKKAESLAKKIGIELGYTVVTGGGGGIMEAANKGANEAGVPSIGATIRLPSEQLTNKYVTQEIPFYFFFSRKVLMTFSAEAYVYFPGGFGTMDEFFEILTLVQTRKIPPVPIILVCSEYWNNLKNFITKVLVEEYKTVGDTELLFHIIDDENEIVDIIRNAPLRQE